MNEQPTFTMIHCQIEQQDASIGQIQEMAGIECTGSTYEEALASVLEVLLWWQEMSTRQSIPPAQPKCLPKGSRTPAGDRWRAHQQE